MAKKVLFVDDDDGYREIMHDVISGEGHSVTLASSGKEALQELSKGCEFDVAIVDLNMPVMNGIELISLIRQQTEIPIILCTGDERAGSLIKGIENIKAMDKTYEAINAMLEELSSTSGWLYSAHLARCLESGLQIRCKELESKLSRIAAIISCKTWDCGQKKARVVTSRH